MTGLLIFFAAIGLLAVLGLLLLAILLVLMGDTEQGMLDEPPTLNTRGPD